ncbi:MAG TPA: SCO family protein [Candidatus Binatia bacterium]|nr:SCO family protein [Candidatus Binatia bacterium]
MPENTPRLPKSIWIGFVLLFGFIGLAFLLWLSSITRNPPIAVIGPVADFTLTNQDGNVTTLADLTNHVWVADIIFTRCAGQCPRMTQQMKSLQDKLPADSTARLVTLTTDPDYDSPAVMKKYGERTGADFNRWLFLTGTKREIAQLGGNELKLSTQPIKLEDRKSPVDLFIHATIFVIVDKHARLRTFFETAGDGVDWSKVESKILKTVRQLENEP